MSFDAALDQVLPADLPRREELLLLGSRHLQLIVEANQTMNLTRIVSEEEAAIKHVLDSVLPWRLFASASSIADAGTGAGFPGIPLAILLPETRFVLLESIQKKARFVQSAVAALGLRNVSVEAVRAEDWLKKERTEILTARAMAPLDKAAALLGPVWPRDMKGLLYKGPDLAQEIAAAEKPLRKCRLMVQETERYELPREMGTRTIALMRKQS
jgi:16S rRNA (guanine527-N7)-methyltransferase